VQLRESLLNEHQAFSRCGSVETPMRLSTEMRLKAFALRFNIGDAQS